jgi:hypothetical protein
MTLIAGAKAQRALRTLRRIDICRAVAQGLAAIEPIEGALYQTRQLELALEAREPQRAARGLAVEATFLAWGGTQATQRMNQVLERAALLAAPGDFYTQGFIEWARGVKAFLSCDWAASLTSNRKAEELFRQGGVGVSWELAMSKIKPSSGTISAPQRGAPPLNTRTRPGMG